MPLPGSKREKQVLQEIVTEAPVEVAPEPVFLQEVVEPEIQIPEEVEAVEVGSAEIQSKYPNLKFKK